MESLYKIDEKGFGWIALQDIKCRTLICKEKFQFLVANELGNDLMSKYDQEEFLKLNNAFSDPNLLNEEMKKTFFDWKNVAESVRSVHLTMEVVNFMLKIRGIYETNFNENFVG